MLEIIVNHKHFDLFVYLISMNNEFIMLKVAYLLKLPLLFVYLFTKRSIYFINVSMLLFTLRHRVT